MSGSALCGQEPDSRSLPSGESEEHAGHFSEVAREPRSVGSCELPLDTLGVTAPKSNPNNIHASSFLGGHLPPLFFLVSRQLLLTPWGLAVLGGWGLGPQPQSFHHIKGLTRGFFDPRVFSQAQGIAGEEPPAVFARRKDGTD